MNCVQGQANPDKLTLPVVPSSTSHPTPYTKPLPPWGWASLPPISDYVTQPVLLGILFVSWYPNGLLSSSLSLLILFCAPHALSSHGLVQSGPF